MYKQHSDAYTCSPRNACQLDAKQQDTCELLLLIITTTLTFRVVRAGVHKPHQGAHTTKLPTVAPYIFSRIISPCKGKKIVFRFTCTEQKVPDNRFKGHHRSVGPQYVLASSHSMYLLQVTVWRLEFGGDSQDVSKFCFGSPAPSRKCQITGSKDTTEVWVLSMYLLQVTVWHLEFGGDSQDVSKIDAHVFVLFTHSVCSIS